MALTALDIYKFLPKTNCKKCGMATCLAFAMKLAAKKGKLDNCPDVTDEARSNLDAASQPPIATVAIGVGDDKLEIGGETVLFRHEKTFFHATGMAVTVSDNLDEAAAKERVDKIKSLKFERVGAEIKVDLIAVVNDSRDSTKFSGVAKLAADSGLGIILISEDPAAIEAALGVCADKKPLIYAATKDNLDAMAKLAKEKQVPLAVKAENVEALAELTNKLTKDGLKDLVLDPGCRTLKKTLTDLTHIRRLALKKNFRALGFPVIAFTTSKDMLEETIEAAGYVAKYASIVVRDIADIEETLPVLALRQNLYTDPQKPTTVEAKLYEIGGTPDKSSPALVTTNFSLTYFTVTPELEAAKKPVYLLVVDAEGMSVLTAWAAEKFTAESINEAIKATGLAEKLDAKKIIIPGYVAVLKAKLEDESGWEVFVGPKEASGLPSYLKQNA